MSDGDLTPNPDRGTISALYVYPIKSCRGVSTPEVVLEPGGPQGDRRYMIVDEEGQFVTQRSQSSLARVDCLLLEGNRLEVSSEGRNALVLEPPSADAPLVPSRIWRDDVLVREVPEGSAWFSELLGSRVRLVHLESSQLRQVNPERAQPGDLVGLADGYPLLWANQASLDDLNERLEAPLPMNRFRPNVVTSGLPAYREDTASEVLMGHVRMRVPKLCDRCVVTTTDQLTGQRGKEPLATLARYRRWDQAVWFAANLVPDQAQAQGGIKLRVGATVTVLQSRRHPRESN
jgi:hypothetical protein